MAQILSHQYFLNSQACIEGCQLLQKSISDRMILNIWKSFREGGNLTEGKVNRLQFKRVMMKQLDQISLKLDAREDDSTPSISEAETTENRRVLESITDAIFDRFKLERFGNDQTKEEEKLDIQDLVVSMTILAHMDTETKLELIFHLTDVDEDGCLSIDDILQMIKRIERNFSIEQVEIDKKYMIKAFILNESSTLHYELSQRRAQRKFAWATQKLNKQVGDQKTDETGLIERKGFLESLKTKEQLFDNFLPQNFKLHDVLKNISQEKSMEIYDNTREQFESFRRDIHSKLRSEYKDKYSFQYLQEQKVVRYPGKVDIISKYQNQEKKSIQILSNFEKPTDKKQTKQNISTNQTTKNTNKNNDIKEDKKDLGFNKEEVDTNNNIDIHKKRLKEMEEKSKSWTLGFKNDKPNQKK